MRLLSVVLKTEFHIHYSKDPERLTVLGNWGVQALRLTQIIKSPLEILKYLFKRFYASISPSFFFFFFFFNRKRTFLYQRLQFCVISCLSLLIFSLFYFLELGRISSFSKLKSLQKRGWLCPSFRRWWKGKSLKQHGENYYLWTQGGKKKKIESVKQRYLKSDWKFWGNLSLISKCLNNSLYLCTVQRDSLHQKAPCE